MNYDKFINILENNKIKVIPIIKNESEIKDIKFVPSFIEFIYREKNAEEKIKNLKNIQNLKDINNLAVGTILNKSEAKFCIENGIYIMFSPHFDEELVKYCFIAGAILIPGVSTPTEIMNAYNSGVKVMKFFPCHSVENINALKEFSKVFEKLNIKFIVTGGVNYDNYKDILKIKNVIAVGSSSIKII